MIFTIGRRSIAAHPVRSAVLAGGFGLGVSVMAVLLGVAEVVLEQSRAPELVGGGDLIATGASGTVGSARFVLGEVLGSPPLVDRVRAASPTTRATLLLVRDGRTVPIRVRGGIPSGERALGDPETAFASSWADTPADRAWTRPDPAEVLRAMDRFHPIPDVPARRDSWAEWLYFNGRAGDTRFYLTFMVGPLRARGRRAAGVRLQLDRAGHRTTYSEGVEIEEAPLVARAPDITIGRSSVRLDGLRYHITLDLPREDARGHVSGSVIVDAVRGRALPPLAVRGAGGWVSGYTVPAMSATLGGWLELDGARVPLDGGTAYHDHNWGFWRGVSWRWGQVQSTDARRDGVSLVYGRIYPPADAADTSRVPGFLTALGPNGPLGYSTDVTIEEEDDPASGRPRRIAITARSSSLDLRMDIAIDDTTVTPITGPIFASGMDFYQLRGRYRVTGKIGEKVVDFVAPGSAETFRGR